MRQGQEVMHSEWSSGTWMHVNKSAPSKAAKVAERLDLLRWLISGRGRLGSDGARLPPALARATGDSGALSRSVGQPSLTMITTLHDKESTL